LDVLSEEVVTIRLLGVNITSFTPLLWTYYLKTTL